MYLDNDSEPNTRSAFIWNIDIQKAQICIWNIDIQKAEICSSKSIATYINTPIIVALAW